MIIKTKNYFTMNLLWYIKSLKPRLKDTLILTFSYHREIIKSEVHLQEEFSVISPCVNIVLVTGHKRYTEIHWLVVIYLVLLTSFLKLQKSFVFIKFIVYFRQILN